MQTTTYRLHHEKSSPQVTVILQPSDSVSSLSAVQNSLGEAFWSVTMDFDASMYDDDHTIKQQDSSLNAEPLATPIDAKRDNALHLRGVDNMSTADVHTYISLFTTDSKPRIEWIDDSSLNLVYYTPEDAQVALAHLITTPTDQVSTNVFVQAHSNPEKPDSSLTVRYAMDSDKKIRGAKDRSRWYLFHPEDDPDSRPRRRRGPGDAAPYCRTGRHERRIHAGTAGSADLFADRVSGTSRVADTDVRPSTADGDLFSDKVQKEATVKDLTGEDLFTKRILEAAKVSHRPKRLPETDLFAQSGSHEDRRSVDSRPLSLAERISGAASSRRGEGDLFADRLGHTTGRAAGGPQRNGMAIKGAGRRSKAADLF